MLPENIASYHQSYKWEKTPPPMNFAFPLPSPFWFSLQMFLKIAPWNLFPLIEKMGRIGEENYVHLSKKLNNNRLFVCSCWKILIFF